MTEQPEADNETYHGYSVDAETQPQDTGDPLDEGYSPPETWSAAQRYGNTPLEEELGESLEQRLAQEVPEPDPYAQAAAEAEQVGGEAGAEEAAEHVVPDHTQP